ncbi:MAG TPA: carboxypeptidase regulatory-like domain-containing protein [Candidatus Polarisedimenticolia bacterium]|nr:carboxypeptidase regulatory-like domain-containing protein [Candidatus Polarisedimenticolia bacterium]
MRPGIAGGIALGVSLLAGEAWAQVSGGIRGRVVDAAGQPLAGVAISVSSRTLQIDQPMGRSDAQGRFQGIALDPAGDYLVKASLAGYATVAAPDVAVRAGQMTTVTIALPPESSVREHVKVTGTASPVDLEERGLTTHLSSEFIDNLPILGRNYQEVLTLSPGVSDVDGDGNPNIHGARDTDVGTYVDGVNTTDPLTGKVGAQLNIESIQEIEVKTAGASAEFGRAQGGFANILTKSGGNEFEGAFKFFWRGSALDGDGAGQDSSQLHGGVGEVGLRDLTFNDYLPFLSLSGPIVKDKAWYFATIEYIQKELPVNAVTQAFVTGLHEKRAFLKGTWQVTANTRLVGTVNYDPQEFTNQGLNSLTLQEAGYTLTAGGPVYTARGTTVLSPSAALETTVSYLDGRPRIEPNLPLDNNGDGILYTDRDGDGFHDASERDGGEDYDGDGKFDIFEDRNHDGLISAGEGSWCFIDGWYRTIPPASCMIPSSLIDDEDGWKLRPNMDLYPHRGDFDRRLTPDGGCEGDTREDQDCDGRLDRIKEDRNNNGMLDPGEDRDGDGRLDPGTEDRNGNRFLDDTPYVTSLYPYGRLAPLPADRDYRIDLTNGIVSGPYHEDYADQRQRATLRQDLSLFTAARGTHDIKIGYLIEKEQFGRDANGHEVEAIVDPGFRTGNFTDMYEHPGVVYDCNPYVTPCPDPGKGRLTAILPTAVSANQAADSFNGGLYVQDTWKPAPNVSLSLGVRFDREAMTTSGYTFFDPDFERDRMDRLLALAVGEGNDDLVQGNNDGMQSLGIGSDPFFGGAATQIPFSAEAINSLKKSAATQLTLHRDSAKFSEGQLDTFFPGLVKDGVLDPAKAAEFGITVQQPETYRITNNNLAPRLAASWDPKGDGRTKLFSAWGRYYDRLFLSTIVGEQGLEKVQRYYVLDRDAIAPVTNLSGTRIGVNSDHQFGTVLSASPPTVTQVDRGLSTPYCDEWLLGFEREIAPETALSVRAVQRRYRDQLQDVDVNHEIRIDPATGEPSDRFGIVTTTQPDDPTAPPVVDRNLDGKPDLFIRNPFYNQVLRVGNYNTARYGAFEVELRRRPSRRWQMQGSYTYSRARGSAEDFQSRLGNDPSTVQSEYGYLDFDQRHVVKVNAGFYLPGDWQMGVSSQWASGLPYSVVSRFLALDNVDNQQFRTLYGFTDIENEKLHFQSLPRNSERNGSTFSIDTSVRKNFVWGRTTWAVSLEVFNLLNNDELRVHTFEPSRTVGFDAGSATLISSPLQLDAERPFGRRFQVGFQFTF